MLTWILIGIGTFVLFAGSVALCASIVPISQYLYYRFIKKDQCPLKYYFSEQLFNRHFSQNVGPNFVRVINNGKELEKLWEIEMTHKLP